MPTPHRGRRGAWFWAVAAALVVVAVISTLSVAVTHRILERGSSLAIDVLSSRPDAVSGGSARVRVLLPSGTEWSAVEVHLGARDVTSQLRLTDAGLEGVVTGLGPAVNELVATAPQVQPAVVTLTNHPISGPVFSGTQQSPYVCQTAAFRFPAARVPLGPAVDAQCSIRPTVRYVYRSSTRNAFLPLSTAAATDPARRPADLATVTSADGVARPFIVRVETSSVDRGIAQVAVLDDPLHPDGAWNRKLVYAFGGRCGTGYRQGTRTVGVLSPNLLGQGFAVASNSLNALEQNCNDVLASEAFAMTREQFIKDHGVPRYTLGVGCGGGALQAYETADNYPGLLDGIVAGCSVADLASDSAPLLFDARLLQDYLRRHPGALTPAQLRSVSGLRSDAQLAGLSAAASVLAPGSDQSAVPAGMRYNAATGKGVRSTPWDQAVNVYGAQSSTGQARRPLGNVGIQYGRAAFDAGAISADQFLALNAGVGGLDRDLRTTSRRTKPDSAAVRAAYDSGRVLDGGGLADIPIIDYRAYGYAPATMPDDLRLHSFVLRDRLTAAAGDSDNLVLLTDSGRTRFDLEHGVVAEAIRQMDRWLTARQASPYGTGRRGLVASKPADLVDACWTATGRKIAEPQTYRGDTACNRLYPSTATPRMQAGGPLSSDVLGCTLRPASQETFARPLTAAQQLRFESVFASGVCDWKVGGVGQRRPTSTWQSY